jgi:hypothetical protein
VFVFLLSLVMEQTSNCFVAKKYNFRKMYLGSNLVAVQGVRSKGAPPERLPNLDFSVNE